MLISSFLGRAMVEEFDLMVKNKVKLKTYQETMKEDFDLTRSYQTRLL